MNIKCPIVGSGSLVGTFLALNWEDKDFLKKLPIKEDITFDVDSISEEVLVEKELMAMKQFCEGFVCISVFNTFFGEKREFLVYLDDKDKVQIYSV